MALVFYHAVVRSFLCFQFFLRRLLFYTREPTDSGGCGCCGIGLAQFRS
jgi:hypothetical protein